MTTPPKPTPITTPKPDPERLRKLMEGLKRNTTAVERTIAQILAELECDEERRAA